MTMGDINAQIAACNIAERALRELAVSSQIPTTSGAFRPVNIVTTPGTVAHVVMPGASTMRGVTGFRIFDAVNGALAQLIPHRVPAAGEGGNSLAIFAGHAADGEPFIY